MDEMYEASNFLVLYGCRIQVDEVENEGSSKQNAGSSARVGARARVGAWERRKPRGNNVLCLLINLDMLHFPHLQS